MTTGGTGREWLGVFGVCVAILAGIGSRAGVPQLVSYQGRVAVNGANFTGTGDFRFSLVDGTGAAARPRCGLGI